MSFVLYVLAFFYMCYFCNFSGFFGYIFVNLTYYICTLIHFKICWCWTPCILASYFWLSLFLRHTVDTVWRALCCEELMSKMLCDSFLVWSLEPEGSTNLAYSRDIHIECSKQFKWNSYFYVSGQSRPFWAALKLL